jgi:hypothetical protein
MLGDGDAALVAEIYTALGDGAARRVLDLLVASPDERLDGATIRQRLGFDAHADVARAVAAIGDAFAAHGVARPWSEAQRGYLLPAGMAAVLARGQQALGGPVTTEEGNAP